MKSQKELLEKIAECLTLYGNNDGKISVKMAVKIVMSFVTKE